jgi:hypothetical protein
VNVSSAFSYASLVAAIGEVHRRAQSGAAGAVNRHLLMRNWLIGARLVEFEQNGADRARYGVGLLKRLSADLCRRGIEGCSPQMLERMWAFYAEYPQIGSEIPSSATSISRASPGKKGLTNSSSLMRKSSPRPLPASSLLRLSWTHFIELLRLGDLWQRAFYENECLKASWSVRQLQRQIGSAL